MNTNISANTATKVKGITMIKNMKKISKAIQKTDRELNKLWCSQFPVPSQHYACIDSIKVENCGANDEPSIEIELRWGSFSDDGKPECQYRRAFFVEPRFFTALYLCGYMQAIEDEGGEHYERNV